MSEHNQAEKQAQQDVLDEKDLDSVAGGGPAPFTNVDPPPVVGGEPVVTTDPYYPIPPTNI